MCEQLGNNADAIGYWERALKLKPEDAEKITKKLEAAKQRQGGGK